jgi:hypothetical protein
MDLHVYINTSSNTAGWIAQALTSATAELQVMVLHHAPGQTMRR